MASFRKFKRSLRCHLKHGTKCPHIERHTIRRPRRRRKTEATEAPPAPSVGRHAAPES